MAMIRRKKGQPPGRTIIHPITAPAHSLHSLMKATPGHVLAHGLARVLALVVGLSLVPGLPVRAEPKVTLKMGDNLPDRSNTWGAIVEQINTEFRAAHPGTEIVTESYQDQPYQQKIKIYATDRKSVV